VREAVAEVPPGALLDSFASELEAEWEPAATLGVEDVPEPPFDVALDDVAAFEEPDTSPPVAGAEEQAQRTPAVAIAAQAAE
jgi:hypothetical protein